MKLSLKRLLKRGEGIIIFKKNEKSKKALATCYTSEELKSSLKNICLCNVLPDTNNLIAVTSKDGARISAPSNTETSRVLGHRLKVRSLLGELSNAALLLKIKDLDAVLGGGADPVLGWVEDKLIDLATSLELVHALALLKIPDEDGTLLASSSAERTLGGNTDGVKVASSTSEVELQLEVLKAPDLDNVIPAARNSNGSSRVGGEGNIGSPLSVTVLLERELALTKSVPELDQTITTARHDLTVIGREGNSKNILGVTDETTSAATTGEIPKTESVIPAAGESIVTIVGQLHVLDKVAVAVETTLSMSILFASASQLPHHDSLIPRTRDKQVSTLASCGQGGDCSFVSTDLSGKLESHL